MCTSPLKAWRDPRKGISFSKSSHSGEELSLPCGQCIECRLKRSRDWAVRCMHEASLHDKNAFITLTYAPEHLPKDSSLDYKHFQKFMKRLRKQFTGTNIRFYMCGEYGENFGRPHFHACLFGIDFPDRKYLTTTKSGSKLYTSKILEKLWPFGLSSIGDVTFQSAGYVARYIMKKITGDNAFNQYNFIDDDGVIVRSREPEFTRMSLKPGIGANWLAKFHSDVYPHDHVIVNGRKNAVPRYYDKRVRKAIFQAEYGKLPPEKFASEVAEYDIDDIQFERCLRMRAAADANSDRSLAARNEHNKAKLKLLKRTIE